MFVEVAFFNPKQDKEGDEDIENHVGDKEGVKQN